MASFGMHARPLAAHLVIAAMLAILGGLYGRTLLHDPLLGPAAGAVLGLIWAVLIGWFSNRLMRQTRIACFLLDAPVALGIVTLGLMSGGGLMYDWMMAAALNEPSTGYRALSALMQPAVPFFITLNSATELLIVPLLVCWNWQSGAWRKTLLMAGVLLYFVVRVWTYLQFAAPRVDMARHDLSPADIAWFRQTLASDFRIVLDLASYVCLTAAGFLRPRLRNVTN